MNFDQLGLSAPLLRQIEQLGYKEPTPIQAQSIPPALDGKDVMGCAQTGTGKTAAFGIPIVEALLRGRAGPGRPFALILAPTRELADQIREAFGTLLPPDLGEAVLLVGGAAMEPQIKALHKKPAIVVATPGRLLDHLMRSNVKLDGVSIFVLDEADRMLDMGFIPQVERILRYLPKKRQNFLFSATLPPSIGAIGHKILREPVRVSVAPSGTTAEGVEQWVYPVDSRSKTELLLHLLDTVPGSTLIFVKTKSGADSLYNTLKAKGEDVQILHGDRTQAERNKALDYFKEGKCRVLVATDVASRGLDVEGIAHVINYDIPMDAESYVHRVGRTARAGALGRSSLFVSFGETQDFKIIQNLIGRPIPEGEVPGGVLSHTSLAPALRPKAGLGGRRGPRRYV